jgi:Na+/melibiose symporter-like transporter
MAVCLYMKLIHNDHADAYGYAAILLCVVFCSILWITLSIPTNYITEDFNKAVAGDEVSEQTASAYDWSVRVFTWILPVSLLALVVAWAFTRANQRNGDE